MERDLLADWASEAEHLYRWIRRAAFLAGVAVTMAVQVLLEWRTGWLISALLAVVVARSFLAPRGRIEVDIILDAVVLGLVTWIVEFPAGWVILAFPVAFAALFGRTRLGIGVGAISLFFGLTPRVVPNWSPADATWIPEVFRAEMLDAADQSGLPSSILIAFLLMVIAILSRRMRAIEQARATSLAAVAHDLRNTAAAVHGLSIVLMDEDLSETGRDVAMALMESSTEHVQLTDDLLALSRFFLEPGAGPVETFDLTELTRRTLANRPDIPVEGDEHAYAIGERGRTAQVIRNLIANATLHGEPPISVRVRQMRAHTLVTVTDHGPGVSAEVERTLFSPSGSSSEGLGIGLSTSRSFAEQMGGTLIHRRESGCTFFELALPSADTIMPPEIDDEVEVEAPSQRAD